MEERREKGEMQSKCCQLEKGKHRYMRGNGSYAESKGAYVLEAVV